MALDARGEGAAGARTYCWTFGNAEFDEARWQLRVAGQNVELEHKPLEVLQYLLRHAGEAVTKDELLASVWAGRVVVEAVLTNAVGKLRRALADEAQDIIQTLPRVGYRLAAPVARKPVEFLPDASRMEAGDTVPRRPNWKLDTLLARTDGNEVWVARHAKTRETRVFKFSLAGKGLGGLKREVTVARLLREALGEREDFVRVLDWDFEQAPYFIESEFGGVSLDRWPDADGIGKIPRECRLALFTQVVEAVGAAHGVGVLHKDLKPANFLVDGECGQPQIRVADFGSSRLFESGVLDGLGITRFDLVQGDSPSPDSSTPLYLAPEVVAGKSATIKSDVYALGVTLYQLLVGDFRRPLSPGWEQDIDDPLLREDIADAANGDPAKRLDSASALAERIRTLSARREKRALEQAVQARIDEGEKRLAKARARRPWMIAATMALVIGLGATGWNLKRALAAEKLASEQRDEATKQAKRAEAVVKFLSNDLLSALAPGGGAFEKDPSIRDMLEYASSNIDGKFKDDPATLGSVHGALGISWRSLGDREQGEHHLREAVASYEQAFGSADEVTLRARYELVGMLAYAQKFDEAMTYLEKTDALANGRLKEDSPMALRAAYMRGIMFGQQQKVVEAERSLRRADALQRRLAPDDVMQGVGIRINLADAQLRQNKLREAEALLRETLDDPNYAPAKIGETYASAMQFNLARVLRNQGNYKDALPLAINAQRISAKVMGEKSWQSLVQLSGVANIYDRAGNCPAALAAFRTVHAGMVESFGAEKQGTLVEAGNLAAAEDACGDKIAALRLLREVIAELHKQDGPGNPHAQVYSFSLSQMLAEQGKYAEALQILGRLDPAAITAGDSTPGWSARLDAARGEILIRMGNRTQGQTLLATALRALEPLQVDDAAELARLRTLLVSD
ncbi:protein kinase domain-containing protein [Thermomonas mangrovi]|uniref:protein kinase domain-containing protein n=1 Tax=Thermomonas mangrovi TaxID=2993316 RepID=UPI0023074CC2|nr:tetratricopeptide repeat protein [Thermomonas mangrovi]